MADQVLVSGMNFATTALLARMLGIHEFGVFSVLYISLIFLNTLQGAAVMNPMMTLAPLMQGPGSLRTFLRGMAGYQYLWSLGFCILASFAALLVHLHVIPYPISFNVMFPFILTVLCFPVQDWFRRFCFVQDLGRTAFSNDVLSYVGQIVCFGLLWWAGRMSIAAAYYAIAATSLIAFAWGFATHDLAATWSEIRTAGARAWKLGRSLVIATQFQWLGSQGIFLLIAAIAGVSAASGIRAVIALMGPVSVIYQSLENVIPVRASRAYAAGGERSLVAYLRRTCAVLAVVVGVPIVLVSVFGRPIMTLFFGHAYGRFAPLVAWEGTYMWLGLVYRGVLYYHRTMNTTGVIARTAMVVAVVSTTACVLLTRRYGVTGGMAALVIGQVMNVSFPLFSAMRVHARMRQTAGTI